MVYEGLDAGDETRRNGDYVGLPHGESEDGPVGDVDVPRGVLVTFNGGTIAESTASGDDHVGVVYAYDVYGDSSNDGPYVDSDSDVTVKVSGTAVVDFSGGISSPDVGATIGAEGNVVVLQESDSGTGHYEVLLR